MSALGIVAFVVVLLLSVMIHEFGHYLTAKAFGMKVTEFFVGFGTRIASFRRGETEYGLKAVPAGGYVKIVGMSDLEEVAPEDEHRSFHRQSAWKQLVVLVAGSAMHFLIALVLLAALFGVSGTSALTQRVSAVSACAASPADGTAVAPVDGACPAGASPAADAGLRVGDVVTTWDGTAITSWEQLQPLVRAAAGREVAVTVERDGSPVQLAVTPDAVTRDGQRIGLVGFSPTEVAVRQDPARALASAASTTWSLVGSSFAGLAALPAAVPALVRQTFTSDRRDADGLVGVVGIARISGDVASADVPLGLRISTFLSLMAGINVFIGIFNLLPLPPLDGGHVLLLLLDRLRSRWARLRGRPAPGRLDVTRVLPAAYLVMVLFIGLSLLLVVADVVNPVRLP